MTGPGVVQDIHEDCVFDIVNYREQINVYTEEVGLTFDEHWDRGSCDGTFLFRPQAL